ncbi:DgyrCDS7782 [Dimorphilus gyrociliatus]|uniref:Histidine ammonia-lyase n=1 Tax=Dimorphilus gyrociliatus TaxID=2664684 RepID=A0A7I8VUM5_9ANNE|nr:DgyrCDS7782 [Dimorphilus gyrociliatus]
MKVSVRVRGEWFAVPCGNGSENIGWLAEVAVKKYYKLKPHSFIDKVEKVEEIRKTKGGVLLDNDDLIRSVLDDNDFVSVVLQSDWSDPKLATPEITYVPEQVRKGYEEPSEFIVLDGNSLSCEDLVLLGKGKIKIKLSNDSIGRVKKARQMLEEIVQENKVVYGITTGFGKFARVVIPKDDLIELQENLIRSHSAGVGAPLSPERTRTLLALRINVLAKGFSGISLKTLNQYIDAFNCSCLPWVPEKGTVGASGDLAPLAHLALGMMGEGKMWSPECGWGEAKYVLESHGLSPIKLGPKEGLSLINGTQFITALGVEAVERADAIARQADVVAALTLEVLKGTCKAFNSDIHNARPHEGQILVAERFRSLLHSDTFPSEIAESHRFCDRVQDAYTIRCCPQVHGVVNDTIKFVRRLLTVEMNSATDNPMVVADKGEIISAGNFHGEYPAKALDYLAIGVHELANISERRIERLINPASSELPAFLTSKGGLNSGFMIAHCTAAALVSENKGLCHPSSVDTLSTSAGTEDHVSMGGWSARKALKIVEHVEFVVAIELLAACQAIEFLRPLKTTKPLEAVYDLVRGVVKPWTKDRFMAPDIEAARKLLQEERLWRVVKPFMEIYREQQPFETYVLSPTTSLHSSAPGIKRRKRNKRASEASV